MIGYFVTLTSGKSSREVLYATTGDVNDHLPIHLGFRKDGKFAVRVGELLPSGVHVASMGYLGEGEIDEGHSLELKSRLDLPRGSLYLNGGDRLVKGRRASLRDSLDETEGSLTFAPPKGGQEVLSYHTSQREVTTEEVRELVAPFVQRDFVFS